MHQNEKNTKLTSEIKNKWLVYNWWEKKHLKIESKPQKKMASRRLSLLQNRTRHWSNPLLVFLGGGGETVRTDAAVATTLSSCGVTNPMQHRPHQHRGSGRHFASSAVEVSEERRRARNIGISALFYLCCCALLFLSLSDWSIDRSTDFIF